VAEKVSQHSLEGKQNELKVTVDYTYNFSLPIPGIEKHEYNLYKFKGGDRYHVQFKSVPDSGAPEGVDPVVSTYSIYVKDLKPVFDADKTFLNWFLTTYKRGTDDVKCITAPDKKGYIIFQSDVFLFYRNDLNTASFIYYTKCDQEFNFNTNFLNFYNVEKDLRELTENLYSSFQGKGRYKVLGMSQHGIVFCDIDDPIECISEEAVADGANIKIYIARKDKLVARQFQKDTADLFIHDITRLLKDGVFDKSKYEEIH
jgi:hypothetical protein